MRRLAASFVTIALAACATTAPAEDQPALLTNPSAQTHAELAMVIGKATLAPSVRLADDVFTRDNRLTLERAQARVGVGQRIDARETEKPPVFRLVKRGDECILIDDRTAARMPLKSAKCKVMP